MLYIHTHAHIYIYIHVYTYMYTPQAASGSVYLSSRLPSTSSYIYADHGNPFPIWVCKKTACHVRGVSSRGLAAVSGKILVLRQVMRYFVVLLERRTQAVALVQQAVRGRGAARECPDKTKRVTLSHNHGGSAGSDKETRILCCVFPPVPLAGVVSARLTGISRESSPPLLPRFNFDYREGKIDSHGPESR